MQSRPDTNPLAMEASAGGADQARARRGGEVIGNIQALRALAALFVVFVHCEAAANALEVPERVRVAFSSGVDLFFVISGFIMVHTTARRRPTPGAFLLNRVVRIVPSYWLLTFLVFIIALVAPWAFQGTKADPIALVKSLLFIPFERADGSMRPILFVGWSLNYEMLFYLLFAGGLFMRSHKAGVAVVSGAIVALAILGPLSPASPEVRFLTSPIVVEFAIGMLIALATPRLRTSSRVVAGAVAAAGAVSIPMLIVAQLVTDLGIIATAVPAAVLVIAAVALEQSGYGTRRPTLILLGDASYALYLVHPFIAVGLALVARATIGFGTAQSIIIIVATFAISCWIGVWFHRQVEKPLTNKFRSVLGLKRMAPPVRGL